jgi:hypothetical protein
MIYTVALRRLQGKQVIVGIDSNAKFHWWFSRMTDVRGSALKDVIIQHNLMLVNTPSKLSTYFSILSESWIDITLATPSAVNEVQKWDVRCYKRGLQSQVEV